MSIDRSLKENLTNSAISVSSTKEKAVIIRDEQIEFPDTPANSVSKAFIRIHNREDRGRELQVMQLMEPFYCKYLNKTEINSKNYIKLPIEFRPRVNKKDYVDKILIRVDGYENPLTCVIKGRCV